MLHIHAAFAKRLLDAAFIIEAVVPYVKDYRGLSPEDKQRLTSFENVKQHLEESVKFGYFDKEKFLKKNVINPSLFILKQAKLDEEYVPVFETFLENINNLDQIKAQVLSLAQKLSPSKENALQLSNVRTIIVTMAKLLKAMGERFMKEDARQIYDLVKLFHSFDTSMVTLSELLNNTPKNA